MLYTDTSQPFGFSDNIPQPVDEFINRHDEIELIEEYIIHRKFRHISIWGEAGVGKTAFAVEYARRLRKYQIFDSIVWTTAKEVELGVVGGPLQRGRVRSIGKKTQRKRQGIFVESLEDLYRAILRVSIFPDYLESMSWDEDRLFDVTLTWLKARRIVLILDDLDSWNDWRFLMRFMEKIPHPSVGIITTRRKLTSDNIVGLAPLQLSPLSMTDSKSLLRKRLTEKGITLNSRDQEEVLRFAEGNPLIINLAVALIHQRTGISLWGRPFVPIETISQIVQNISGNRSVAEFLFDDLYKHLTPRSKQVLLCIAMLAKYSSHPTLTQIEQLSGITDDQLNRSLKELHSVSLIDRIPNDDNPVDIHDLTYEFVMHVEPEKTLILETKAEELFVG